MMGYGLYRHACLLVRARARATEAADAFGSEG
jgi:hypothetical protein